MSNDVNFVVARTKDIGQAAFYWCQPGAELKDLFSINKKVKDVIIFNIVIPINDEQFKQLQLDYANGKALVEPNLFVAKQNSLRDLLYAARGNLRKVIDDGADKECKETSNIPK